jgi:predicted DNA-binding transcriptional regulator AlpA
MAQTKPRAIVGLAAAGSAGLLTIPEVAHLLRISRWTLWEWRRNGTGPAYVKLSRGVLRYPRRALASWLNQHMRRVSDGGTVGQFRQALRG